MSGYGGGETDALSRRLRDAERARGEAERAHADALSQLRAAQRSAHEHHTVEQLQSRARELEKKVTFAIVHFFLAYQALHDGLAQWFQPKIQRCVYFWTHIYSFLRHPHPLTTGDSFYQSYS